MSGYALALHGGAGAFSSTRIPGERIEEMRRDLRTALDQGVAILAGGGSALSAVVRAVSVLEDSRVFNAARGAVLRRDGSARLDASLMCGATRRAGAVGLACTVQNPIQLAQAVLERGEEVLLCGADADELAREIGLPTRPPDYFITEYRLEQLQRLRERSQGGGTPSAAAIDEGQTVGAVALDLEGHLAAATSTGGTTHSRVGRIGDSPIVGAGTWASDASCAVSATGAGEYFLRAAFAHEVHARITWQKVSLREAVRSALDAVVELGGSGGCVAIHRTGRIVTPYTTLAMPRAWHTVNGERAAWVLEHEEEPPAG